MRGLLDQTLDSAVQVGIRIVRISGENWPNCENDAQRDCPQHGAALELCDSNQPLAYWRIHMTVSILPKRIA